MYSRPLYSGKVTKSKSQVILNVPDMAPDVFKIRPASEFEHESGRAKQLLWLLYCACTLVLLEYLLTPVLLSFWNFLLDECVKHFVTGGSTCACAIAEYYEKFDKCRYEIIRHRTSPRRDYFFVENSSF